MMAAFTVGGNPGRGPAIRGSWPAIRGSWPAIRGSWPAIRGSWPFARGASAPLVSPGGQMILFTADPALLQEGELYMIQGVANLPPLPADKKAIGQAYWLAASPAVTQVLRASISFLYLTVDVMTEGANEDELTIHYWDGEAWETLPSVRNAYRNQISAASRGPGLYALLAGATAPQVHDINPRTATNDVTTTLVISGRDFLRPVAVQLTGSVMTYTLPVLASSPLSVTAAITEGLPAGEYQVVVTNLYNEAPPASAALALYSAAPPGACFYDLFTSGSAKWQRSGRWDIVTLPDGNRAMTDSPDGNYDSTIPPAVTAATSITSLPFSLAACPKPELTFRHDYLLARIGASEDTARVEITTDGGRTWQELARFTGGGIYGSGQLQASRAEEWAEVNWKPVTIDLAGYTGTGQLRFTLEVDRYASDKGWLIDDVQVRSELTARACFPLLLR